MHSSMMHTVHFSSHLSCMHAPSAMHTPTMHAT